MDFGEKMRQRASLEAEKESEPRKPIDEMSPEELDVEINRLRREVIDAKREAVAAGREEERARDGRQLHVLFGQRKRRPGTYQ